MIMTVTCGLIVRFRVVVIVVMLGAHRVLIIRAVLSAGKHRGQPGYCKRRQGKYGRLQKLLAHDTVPVWWLNQHGMSSTRRRP